jgi:hypothetical protein
MKARRPAACRSVVARRALANAFAAALFLGAAGARASADAGASIGEPPPLAATAHGGARSACIEHIPEGKERPKIEETFPARGRAGYAAKLVVEVPHGLGETVLPGGFRLQLDSPEGKAIQTAGFVIPSLDGPAAPRVVRSEQGGQAKTSVELPFVPLPKEPGPQTLTLPSVPIAIARPSGELITLCTTPHELAVDDPTANIAQATPRPNPPPQRQLEVWTAAKNVALGALIALPLGALVALAVGWWLRRQKPLPPPPPPRPAWELALEGLARVREKRLIEQGLTSELFDEVSLLVRDYLGRRFGFDGLESTTRELLEHIARLGPNAPEPALVQEIEVLMRRADLVKFANLAPEAAECELALERGERIVRGTMVAPRPAVAVAGAPPQPVDRGGAP